ncbi:MAG: hypothetical protein WD942_06780 [Dehalococcoidia bacterium]
MFVSFRLLFPWNAETNRPGGEAAAVTVRGTANTGAVGEWSGQAVDGAARPTRLADYLKETAEGDGAMGWRNGRQRFG